MYMLMQCEHLSILRPNESGTILSSVRDAERNHSGRINFILVASIQPPYTI